MSDDSPGRYRVLARIDRDGTLALVVVDLTPTDDPTEAYEPLLVRATGYEDDLADRVASLEPGNVIAAELDWTGTDASEATFASLSVERRTRYQFADDVEGLFEAARDAWDDARESGEAMNSRVTRDTDGDPNGALYVFADPEQRDVFEEFRTGRRPIEPLVERVNEQHTDDGKNGENGDSGDESAGSEDLQTGSLAARLPTAGDDGDGGDDGHEESGTAGGPPERDVFVIRPADGAFVVVHIAFRKDGLLAETMRDTYDELAE